MKLAIAIPTYNRPVKFKEFLIGISDLLSDLQIPVHVFHNEPTPKYSPDESSILTNYFSSDNQGIQGNTRNILNRFAGTNYHVLITSDEETLLGDGLRYLQSNNNLSTQACGYFNRKISSDACKWNFRPSLNNNLSRWLALVPFTETCYFLKVDKSALSIASSLPFFRKLPIHSYLLVLATQNSFRGCVVDQPVYTEDHLGSVSSGWPSWIPNIICCNYIFLSFLLYAEDCIYGPRPSAEERALSAVPYNDYLPGLIGQIKSSLHYQMPSGRRLSGAVYRMCMSRPSSLSSSDIDTLDAFLQFNEYFPYNEQISKHLFSKFSNPISTFISSYPEWNTYNFLHS